MSTQKTDNLGMHRWGLDDFLNNDEWNENFKLIDAIVGACRMVRTTKDAEGVFTKVEFRSRAAGNALVMKVELSGGTSPQYTTRTCTIYEENGTTIKKTITQTISYDADGDWTVIA